MLGLAIAFGIGGRDLAQRFLERKFVRAKKEEEGEDETFAALTWRAECCDILSDQKESSVFLNVPLVFRQSVRLVAPFPISAHRAG